MIDTSFLMGLALVIVGGIIGGSWATPSKCLRFYKYEQWLFVMALCGPLLLPWVATFLLCPHVITALSTVPLSVFVKANLFTMAWGVANTLFGFCLARIGFSMTIGIMTGIGLPLGVIIPMILKGSGRFADAPSPLSGAGLAILAATAVILAGVILAAIAGHEREKGRVTASTGKFLMGLAMAVAVGVLQIGQTFAFVYSQGPIVAALTGQGAGSTGASFGVWAATMPGGAILNIVFAGYLMSRNHGWHILTLSRRDLGLSLSLGLGFFLVIACMGMGMRLLGPLGASVGFGVSQAFQIVSAQVAGIAFGEWKDASRQSRLRMGLAVGLMIVALAIMAAAKSVA